MLSSKWLRAMKEVNRKSQGNWLLHLLGASETLLLAMALSVPGWDIALLAVALSLGMIFMGYGIFSTRGFFNPLGWLLVWGFIGVFGVKGWLFPAAFWASRPALHHAAGEANHDDRNTHARMIGLFRFSSVESIDGGVVFTFSKKEIPWGRRGIYFSFSHEPIDCSGLYSEKELSGGWYSWHYGGW